MELGYRLKRQTIPVHVADDIAIMILRISSAGNREMLRAEHQDFLASDLLNRRAFPHIPEVLKSRHIQLTSKDPAMQQIFTAVDQGAAMMICCLSTENDVIAMHLRHIQNLRITLMFRIVRIRSE